MRLSDSFTSTALVSMVSDFIDVVLTVTFFSFTSLINWEWGKRAPLVGTSETKQGKYAIQCFSQLSSFRISYEVKGVDSVSLNYENILSASTNKTTSEGLSPRSFSFSSKMDSLSRVAAFMLVRVGLFKLRPQR